MIDQNGAIAGLRVGVDLVRIADVADSVANFNMRYLRRVFSPMELSDCSDDHGVPEMGRLAARYAAKEACLKVLRPQGRWFNWQEIEIARSSAGWTSIQLSGSALRHADHEGLRQFSVSLSHETDYAVAVVVGSQ